MRTTPNQTPTPSLSLTVSLEWGEAIDLMFLLDMSENSEMVSLRTKLRAALNAAQEGLAHGNQD